MFTRPRHRGFTVVELLVVTAIIGLLIAILLPTLRRMRQSAQVAGCLANMRQLAAAVHLYAGDHKNNLPFIPPRQHFNGDGTAFIGGSRGIIYDEEDGRSNTADGYLPAIQNRALNRYVGGGEVWRCPSDYGIDIHDFWPQITWLPTVWEYTGSSYNFNDYVRSEHASVDESDFGRSPWNAKLNQLPRASQFILFYEPPAQIWPLGNGPQAAGAGKVFRWHLSRRPGSYCLDEAGGEPVYANVAYADGHAETIDFSLTLRRDKGGRIVGQDRTASERGLWYIPAISAHSK